MRSSASRASATRGGTGILDRGGVGMRLEELERILVDGLEHREADRFAMQVGLPHQAVVDKRSQRVDGVLADDVLGSFRLGQALDERADPSVRAPLAPVEAVTARGLGTATSSGVPRESLGTLGRQQAAIGDR